MTPEQRAWEDHRRSCRRCQRQSKRWEDGEMTCELGVDLFFAAREAQVTLW